MQEIRYRLVIADVQPILAWCDCHVRVPELFMCLTSVIELPPESLVASKVARAKRKHLQNGNEEFFHKHPDWIQWTDG